MRSVGLLLAFVAVARCMPAAEQTTPDDGVFNSAVGVVKDCLEGDMSLCLKERALRYAENLANSREVSISDGVTLISSGAPRSARSLEPLSAEPQARESQIEERLLETFADFFEHHTLQFRMPKQAVDEVKRSLEEGRKKKKKLKMLLPLLILLKLKAAALIPILLGGLALIAFKALIIGKLALLISGAIALKKLLSAKHGGGSNIEVYAHPHEEHSYGGSGYGGGGGGGGGGHGWGRSQDDAQALAYSAHTQ